MSTIFLTGFFLLVPAGNMALFRPAFGHGVAPMFYHTLARMDEESFSTNTLQSGQILTITGKITSLVAGPLEEVSMGYSVEGTNSPKLHVVSVDPSDKFIIPAKGTLDFKLTLNASQSGTGHVHSALIGMDGDVIAMGSGQTVQAQASQSSSDITTVNVGGNNTNLQLNSQYTISDFKVDKGISFVIKDGGQSAARGSISIQGIPNSVLRCPCELMIDGQNYGKGQSIESPEGERTGISLSDGTSAEIVQDPNGSGSLFMNYYASAPPIEVKITGSNEQGAPVAASGFVSTAEGGIKYIESSTGLQVDFPIGWKLYNPKFHNIITPPDIPSSDLPQPDAGVIILEVSGANFDNVFSNLNVCKSP